MNNRHGDHGPAMMWAMMLMCLAPLVFIIFSNGLKKFSWTPIIFIAAMLALHRFLHRQRRADKSK